MKFYNIIFTGKAGAGKSHRCKADAIELLKCNRNCVAIYDWYNEYKELNIDKSRLILESGKDNEKGLLKFLETVYNTAFKDSASNEYTIIIEGMSENKVDTLEFIHSIKKLNDINVSVRIVVQEVEEIFRDYTDIDIYMPWFKENFEKGTVKRY